MRTTNRRAIAGALLAVPLLVAGLMTTGPAAAVPVAAAGVSSSGPDQPAESSIAATDDDPAPRGVPEIRHDRYRPADCATLSPAERDADIPYVRCFALGYTGASGRLLSNAAGPLPGSLGPADLQQAYQLPDGGAGMTVAIVVAGGYTAAEADLAVFRDEFDLPPCTADDGCFRKIDQRGGTAYPPQDAGWSIEAAMDLDAVSAVCPACQLLLVLADTAALDDMGEAVNTAAALGADAISNSYGVDGELPAQEMFNHYYDHPGIVVTVSSGDTGNVQSWPATYPNVVAVGGTSLVRDYSERGWQETVWGSPAGGDGAGSGCSLYEPQPQWQQGLSTGCGNHRATADISAVADPQTGLAVYNSSAAGGWSQYGGTSLSAPLIAGMYALAGPVTPGSYPVSYPYANPHALFDVTEGANGPCGTLLCQAAAGWDGPTGLGTPNGVEALTQGVFGEISGRVIDAATGGGLAGVDITATDVDGSEVATVSADDGTFALSAPVGSYTVAAAAFGYAGNQVPGVEVTDGGQFTADLALTALPSRTVSGRVTDGSGHGWPLRARITVDGTPAATYSDPYTGQYSFDLPLGENYTLRADPVDLPGYAESERTVDLRQPAPGADQLPVVRPQSRSGAGTSPAGRQVGRRTSGRVDLSMSIDPALCTTPGYTYHYQGTSTDFGGWDAEQPQDGWTVTDDAGTGKVWVFADPGGKGNRTGGSGTFAIVDNWYYPDEHDTSLVSPTTDLTGIQDPEIGFRTDYYGWDRSEVFVDLSLDDGATWTTVWHQDSESVSGHVGIPVPQAAGSSTARVRFRYTGSYDNWWQLDDVYLGTRSCDAVPGGLLAGVVRDDNTGDALNGATVRSGAVDTEYAVSRATPDDPSVPDGFYVLYSSQIGRTPITAELGAYTPAEAFANVPADEARHRNIRLRSGMLTVNKQGITATERLGVSKSRVLRFGNDGTQPVHVVLGEQERGMTPMSATGSTGAPTTRLSGAVSYRPLTASAGAAVGAGGDASEAALRSAADSGSDVWRSVADFPTPIMDNVVATLGTSVYSVGGTTGFGGVAAGYRYDPSAQQWTPIADLPAIRQAAMGDFIGDTLYVTGGWDDEGASSTTTYAYRPGRDAWTTAADLPEPLAAGASAVLDGQLYVIGGCGDNCRTQSGAVFSYDAASDSWTRRADYPKSVAFHSCAAAGDRIVCAGGVDANSSQEFDQTYVYDSDTDSWSAAADLPMTVAGAATSGSGGKLQLVGGVVGGMISNQSFEYDPAADTWSELPNANHALYRGGGACGMYRIGGAPEQLQATPLAEQLPGYGCAADDDVAWLATDVSEFDVAPGKTVAVRVRLESAAVPEPGTYRAGIAVTTDTPYGFAPVSVDVTVKPLKRWGKLTGTVTDGSGSPLSGVTVEICTMYTPISCGPVSYTLITDSRGHYHQWLDKGFSPVSIIAAKDGYRPKLAIAKVRKGQTTTVDFTLPKP